MLSLSLPPFVLSPFTICLSVVAGPASHFYMLACRCTAAAAGRTATASSGILLSPSPFYVSLFLSLYLDRKTLLLPKNFRRRLLTFLPSSYLKQTIGLPGPMSPARRRRNRPPTPRLQRPRRRTRTTSVSDSPCHGFDIHCRVSTPKDEDPSPALMEMNRRRLKV